MKKRNSRVYFCFRGLSINDKGQTNKISTIYPRQSFFILVIESHSIIIYELLKSLSFQSFELRLYFDSFNIAVW